MKPEEARICILRVGGTNCDAETARAFRESMMKAHVVHFGELVKKRNLLDYDVIVIPGGFSHGDYVRAGAIWAKRLMAKLKKEVALFLKEERLILGICNGFQVLVEAGLLPRFERTTPFPEAALGQNLPPGYNCRWVHLKHENHGNCVFTRRIPYHAVVKISVAHSEGRFMFETEKEDRYWQKLLDNDQVVFRYCHHDGEYAEKTYPANPNGSAYDIAGICDPSGTIFGLMPHPERAYFGWQLPHWTRKEVLPAFGDGRLIFDSVLEYVEKKL